MPSAYSRSLSEELFAALAAKFPACEEVYVFTIKKTGLKIKKPPKQAAFAVA
jgi:hypothetical protein